MGVKIAMTFLHTKLTCPLLAHSEAMEIAQLMKWVLEGKKNTNLSSVKKLYT